MKVEIHDNEVYLVSFVADGAEARGLVHLGEEYGEMVGGAQDMGEMQNFVSEDKLEVGA